MAVLVTYAFCWQCPKLGAVDTSATLRQFWISVEDAYKNHLSAP